MEDRKSEAWPPAWTRRAVVRALSAACLSSVAAFSGARCGSRPADPAPTSAGRPLDSSAPGGSITLRVPRPAGPEGSRTTVLAGDRPVELRHVGRHYEARVLLCTHQGCPVMWDETIRQYRCPCHEGTFDEAGRPLFGPPTRPLQRVDVQTDGDELILHIGPVVIDAEVAR